MFTPFGTNVTVREDEKKTQTDSGILLPADKQERFGRGTVVAVGAGKYSGGSLIPLNSKPGDKILFRKRMDNRTDTIEDGLILIQEDEIVGKFE